MLMKQCRHALLASTNMTVVIMGSNSNAEQQLRGGLRTLCIASMAARYSVVASGLVPVHLCPDRTHVSLCCGLQSLCMFRPDHHEAHALSSSSARQEKNVQAFRRT